MHGPSLGEPHLMLCRVDVDVNVMRINLKVEHIGGNGVLPSDLGRRLPYGMHQETVAHRPAVHEEILVRR